MKKLLVVPALLFSLASMADCRNFYELKFVDEFFPGVNDMIEVSAAGGHIAESAAGGIFLDRIIVTIKNLAYQKSIDLVDEAYAYIDTGVAGKKLKKLQKALGRKKAGMDDLAMLIINGNEDGTLCEGGRLYRDLLREARRGDVRF
jgi:hypothetical protein